MRERCRACHALLPEETLLEYGNMPKSAQFFPTAETADRESGVTITLKECPYCGLVQAMGEPVPYYRDVIRAVGVSEEMKRFRREQFSQWVSGSGLAGKRIIEIGSGRGEYLALMKEAGVQAWGLEHDPAAVSAGRAEGLSMLEGFPEDEDTPFPGGPYDGFFCLNFLEHIPAPGAFLRGIYRNLAPGARGLVEVPNFRMMLERSLYSEFIQDHLSYFTGEALENLLSVNGFRVLSLREIWQDYILSAQVEKRAPADVSGMEKKRGALRRQVQGYLRSCEERGLTAAAWGAGHQALANLSLLGMEKGIACVIDSAPFKQDHLTPATHLPIVSPAVLDEGRIGAVIIMAAGYSGEIRELLARKHPRIEVSVLGDEFTVFHQEKGETT